MFPADIDMNWVIRYTLSKYIQEQEVYLRTDQNQTDPWTDIICDEIVVQMYKSLFENGKG